MRREEILNKLNSIFMDILDEEDLDISEEKLIFSDFSFESMDLMELAFRFEQVFEITIAENELWNLPGYIVNSDMFEDGKFNEAALELINKYFKIPLNELYTFTSPFMLNDYITVGNLITYIDNKINK